METRTTSVLPSDIYTKIFKETNEIFSQALDPRRRDIREFFEIIFI